jgi:glycosyltransferase involved in cell wall biosynthesis
MTATFDPTPTPSIPAAPEPAQQPASAPRAHKLSIVIPIYNEGATIHTLIGMVVNASLPAGMSREIICVNDCSADDTGAKLDQLPAAFPGVEFKIHHKPQNEGKGAALRDGFARATGDLVLVQDADLEYDPHDYGKLLEPILQNKADVVYGSRFIGEPHRVLYFWHSVANKGLTALSNMFTNLNLTDMEVCYKVFRKSVLDRITLRCNRFGFEPEVTAKVAKLRPSLRIYEVGVAYHGRSYEEGKKITWKDGIKAVLAIIRFRFTD